MSGDQPVVDIGQRLLRIGEYRLTGAQHRLLHPGGHGTFGLLFLARPDGRTRRGAGEQGPRAR